MRDIYSIITLGLKNKLTSLCRSISQRVVLIGGVGDKEAGDLIKTGAGAHVVNSCGKYSVLQSASIIAQSTIVITHDTGMMHIAAALQKRIISVWGNTVPEFGMYPYYGQYADKNTTIEVKNLSCRPCSKIGYESCPKRHFKCMEEIEIERLSKITKA